MRWGRLLVIIISAVTITAFGIDAADTLKGESSTMLAQLVGREVSPCPAGMRAIDTVMTLTCVDVYEASPGSDCPYQVSQSTIDTLRNIQVANCHSVSKEGGEPWRFVTREQALQLCAREGKRLPTAAEWYAVALGGAGEAECNTNTSAVSPAGALAACVTSQGVHDLIGNVWEWVSDDVRDGTHNGAVLPASGYVARVDSAGIATGVGGTPAELFNQDYFWSKADGVYGMIRGGFYGSGDDAGLYSVHADTAPSSASPGIGFRCVS